MGAPVVDSGIQVSVVGLYRPPVFSTALEVPPQTIISVPVQIAVWYTRGAGAPVVDIALQVFVVGL